jgi:hypothetical protein
MIVASTLAAVSLDLERMTKNVLTATSLALIPKANLGTIHVHPSYPSLDLILQKSGIG